MQKGEILIYGEIGTFPGGVSAKFIQQELNRNKDEKEIVLLINSVGGDVFEGYAIYNALKQSGKKIRAVVQGMCASIATLISSAAQEVVMSEASEFFIHDPFAFTEGNADKLRDVADQLDNIKKTIINVYKERTNLSEDELWALMKEEKSYSPEQAVEAGFADKVAERLKAVARYDSVLPKEETTPKTNKERLSFIEKKFNELKNWLSTVKNVILTTDTGVMLELETEQAEVGAMVWVIEEGERIGPAPEGEHVIAETGMTIMVDAEGKIAEIIEGNMEDNAEEDTQTSNNADSTKTENMSAEDKRIEILENTVARLEKALEAKQENEKKAAYDKRVGELEAQLKALKDGMPLGDDEDIADSPVVSINRKAKAGSNEESFDNMAKALRKQIYG